MANIMNRLLLFKKPMSYIGGQVKWGSRSVIGNKEQRIPAWTKDLLAGNEPWILQAGWADLGGGRFQFTNTGANNDVYKEINTKIKAGETYVMYYTIEALTAGAHAGRCAGNTSGTSTQATGTRRVPPFTAIVPGVDVTGVRAFPATDGFIVSDIRLYLLADDPGS